MSTPTSDLSTHPSTSTSSSAASPGRDEDDVPPRSVVESENERHDYYSSEDELDPQTAFHNWFSSLKLLDRKMLAVMLSVILPKRFNLTSTSGPLEAAWITGFNEKTIHGYRKGGAKRKAQKAVPFKR